MADATQFDLTGLLNLLKAVQSVSANPEPQPDLPNGGYSSDQATKWISWHSGKLQSFQSLGNSGTGGPSTPTPGPAVPTDFPQLPPALPGPTIPTDYPNLGPPPPPAIPTDFPNLGPPPPSTPTPTIAPSLASTLGGQAVPGATNPAPEAIPANPPTTTPDVSSGGTMSSLATNLPTTQSPTPGLPSSSGNTGILRK